MMFRRLYHVSSVMHSLKKQGIKLNKMVHPKAKKQWYPSQIYTSEPLPSVKSLTKVKHEPGKQGIRRLAMLNKMFMKHITDLMSTGTVSMDIVGRSIEISKVKITPDYQTVHVFWVCKGSSSDIETEAVLNRIAGVLRHELSTLRVMGEVPYIVFVKDVQEARLVDLNRRLAVADYGEDYTPTDLGHLLKTEFTLDVKLSPEMKAKIKQLEEEIQVIEEPLPEMTHNVFGLDHAKIMNRLLAARKKSRDAWSSLEEGSPVISYRSLPVKSAEPDTGNQKQELADFLMKRQILQNKIHKEMRESREDWQYLLEDKQEEEEIEAYEEYEEYEDDYDYSDKKLYEEMLDRKP